MRLRPFIFVLLLFYAPVVMCQKGLNSIYSAYGIGDYKMRAPNTWLGMGNVGVAIPSQNAINEINPGSFGWIPKDKFQLEITLGGSSNRYVNEYVNTQAGDFSIARAAIGLQVVNPIKTVIGLRRFSQVEYYTTLNRQIAGSATNLKTDVEGNGGLYQLYMGNAVLIGKKLSLGISTGFIFGSVNQKVTMTLNEAESLISEKNKYYNQGSLSAGLQYQFGKGKSKWMFGAFYEPQIRMNVLVESQLKDQGDVVLGAKDQEDTKFIYPQKYGAGLTFSRNTFSASVDMIGHLWSSTGYRGDHFNTTDAYSISAGVRHQFIRNTMWGKANGTAIFAGYNRETSYLIIEGKQLLSNAATLGATFPSRNNLNYYTIGCKIGTRGRAVYPMIKENFFEFNFNLNFGGFFYKGKKYD